jgi:hypothetical protein
LVENALSISETHSESHLRAIEQSTCGIIFLGTPHRGSDLADFARTVAKVLKLTGKRVAADILDVLRRDSQVLAVVEDWFHKWLRRRSDGGRAVKITSFYEELSMPGNIIVSKTLCMTGIL